MKIRFRVNIGSVECKQHGLDFRDCVRDAELDVSDDVGAYFIDRKLAEPVEQAGKVKTVPSASVKTSDSK